MPEKLSMNEVNRLGADEFAARFGSLFEHSSWVAAGTWSECPFADIPELHGAFLETVRDAPAECRIGFDEGPKMPDWKSALEQRGISVARDVCRDEATSVLREYAERGGIIYNARQGD